VVNQDIGQEIAENLHQEIENEEEIEEEEDPIVVDETERGNAAALDQGIAEITEEVVVLDLKADQEAQDVIVKDLEAEVVLEAQRRTRRAQADLQREKRVALRARVQREAGKDLSKEHYKVFSNLNC